VVPHAVPVLQRSVQDVRQDLHVPVRVGRESGAGGDTVLVDDPQVAEPHVALVVVVAEGEGVARVQPPEVELPALR
jgi:hypothetical protein